MKISSQIIDELATILNDIREPLDLYEAIILKDEKSNSAEVTNILDKIRWDAVSYYHYRPLSHSLIREFKDRVDWNTISRYQKLSETFIKEFQNDVNWDIICIHQRLSETFIQKYQNKVNWTFIFGAQDLSDIFIEKYRHRAYWELVPMVTTYKKKYG